ncbi:hypothetical protein NKI48_21640 [Mesorhizobium sp. M0644]
MFGSHGASDPFAQLVVDRIAAAQKQRVVHRLEGLRVLEHRQAEFEQAAVCLLPFRHAPVQRLQMRLQGRTAQLVLAGVMGVEGRPADISLLADVLHGECRVAALGDQGNQRVLQQGARARATRRSIVPLSSVRSIFMVTAPCRVRFRTFSGPVSLNSFSRHCVQYDTPSPEAE